jgi:hypothetical protein
MSLIFKPEKHEYISIDGDDISWTSVTSIISKLKQPFDSDKIALRSSKSKKSKWYGLTPDQIKTIWKLESTRATDLGTWYHNQRENDICGLETIEREGINVPIFKPIEVDNVRHSPSQKLEEGIYPEHFVYLKSAGLCGQSDLVEVINNKVHITDYKTNKEIKTEGYTNWDGVTQKMNHPVAHLDDCHLMHYTLQLSLYMYIIIKHNPRLSPGKLTIHHILFEEAGRDQYDNPITALDTNGDPIVKDVIPYELPYLKQEIISIINWWKDNNQDVKRKS